MFGQLSERKFDYYISPFGIIWPNPFTDQAVLQYTLPESGKVLVRILNQFGMTVKLTTEVYQQAGSHQIIIDDTDLKSAEAYYYQVLLESTTKSYQVNGKMVLIK